jgi:glycerol-3-phosphate dehydrogenase
MRNLNQIKQQEYDVIIVGAGIYGVCLALEATRRRLKPLLLDCRDFGSQTSFNHLRIIHGGLRYLQACDLKRYFMSISEQAWFLSAFPDLVEPLPCLMPLYNKGLKRTSIFKAVLSFNNLLSRRHYAAYPCDDNLPAKNYMDAKETVQHVPYVQTSGLRGSAIWQDAYAPNSPRLLYEILRWSITAGAVACNYFRVDDVLQVNGRVSGVKGVDLLSSEVVEFKSPIVINATGPDCRQFASHVQNDVPALFPHRVLVWNVLFKREALSAFALALTNKGRGHTYFMPPWHGQLMVGTGHTVLEQCHSRAPNQGELDLFLVDINVALPGINLQKQDILRVLSGVMPGNAQGDLAPRDVFIEHGTDGGLDGFYSVSGNKFTIARHVADEVMSKIFKETVPAPYFSDFVRPAIQYSWSCDKAKDAPLSIDQIIKNEHVHFPEDLILRRTDLFDTGVLSPEIASNLANNFATTVAEINRRIHSLFYSEGGP